MSTTNSDSTHNLVLVTASDGISLIQTGTPLTRLNYFDGKFLRAADLEAEQRYLRELVKAGNRAGGSGVVYGLELRLTGDDGIRVSPGLAIDGSGQAILVPAERTLSVAALIEAPRGSTATDAGTATGETAGCFESCAEPAGETTTAAPANTWYLITIAYAEALCGEEDVYGALCEQACVTTTNRPLRVEGALLRARPLIVDAALAASGMLTLRSALASAYFVDEAARQGCGISASTLHSGVWCAGALGGEGNEVPLGVLVREGTVSRFLDLWTARREHIDSPPKRYWQWCMGMRPWNVFLAQVLQFQCQLRDLLVGQPAAGGSGDPCGGARSLVGEAASQMGAVSAFYQALVTGIGGLSDDALTRVLQALEAQGLSIDSEALAALHQRLEAADAAYKALPANGRLVHLGIIELPSAGYLPVSPSDTLSVDEQVRRLLGDGLDLRFCTCRPDYVPHALEEAQHLERIPLLESLDHPGRRPQVDILVPNGEILRRQQTEGPFFEVVAMEQREEGTEATDGGTTLRGVARGEALPGGGGALYFAGIQDAGTPDSPPADSPEDIREIGAASHDGVSILHGYYDTETIDGIPSGEIPAGTLSIWLEARCDPSPFALPAGGESVVNLKLVYGVRRAEMDVVWVVDVAGRLRVGTSEPRAGGDRLDCTFDGDFWRSRQNAGQSEHRRLQAQTTLTLEYTAPGARHLGILALTHWITAEGAMNRRRLMADLNWSGAPIAAQGSYSGIEFTPDRTFSATEDATLADPADARRQGAVHAIETLAETAGPEFSETALARLFPPARQETGAAQVRATRDWVLFHRRRERRCADDLPAPVPAATAPAPEATCHSVYWLTPAADKQLTGALFFGRLEDVVRNRQWTQPLGEIQFSGMRDEIQPDPDPSAISDEWQRLAPECAVAGIISFSSVPLESLPEARVRSQGRAILDLLGPSAEPSSDFRQLDPVPGDCSVVSLVIPQSHCLEVYLLRPQTGEELKQIDAAVQQGDITFLTTPPRAALGGFVQFCATTGRVYDTRFETLGESDRLSWAYFALRPGSPGINEPQAGEIVSAEVISRLATEGGEVDLEPIEPENDSDWPSDCPLLAFAVLAVPG